MRLQAVMENTSLQLYNLTNDSANWSEAEEDVSHNLFYTRDLALRVIYIIIGTVGIVDNLFVIVIFVIFVKIADKVYCTYFTSLGDILYSPCFCFWCTFSF